MTKEKDLKRLMEIKSGSVKAFSEEVGLAYTTVRSILERGIFNAKVENVIKICKGLDIKPEDIMGIEKPKAESSIETLPVKKIPVVSKISAGLPIYSEENLIDYIYFATDKIDSNKEEFGLKVSGDSMDKIFQDGDVVVIEKDSTIENGQLGVVMINGYNATVKRIRYNGDQIILIPESNNPNHYPQVYSAKDEVKIVGRVVASQRFF
ncbi:XRE family transcriptional regulator [Staphylococcus gallinarum]|uniref:XRE family transcriptional regulator n=1 Tax=Staphylococcus gallinarum TaxID=1293 RepID=UPI001E2A472B|nr:XRE family transcriptional regulator [Staphylococcus gallinarum]MCD8830260.1 XRE family transcriptional regulator [Staphylococcus gallinarum]MCD8920938.1 XRE family transcriptional regulator [Staphylococcus gallinarum]MEB6054393.1 XRE family transcriptional regulator [Staphylococcus gallinarum]MEB7040120.1 XRE family transcriptional regulator [Staphylococcus gallinarum]UEH01051.1 XRE family transcriptional regulator [Staphylococcus gallinarum]